MLFSWYFGETNYSNLRKANKQAKFQGYSVLNYVSYKELTQVINTTDIGTAKYHSDHCSDNKSIPGVYRKPIEFMLRLTEFY